MNVLVPAARLVGPDLALRYGAVPPLLVPLRGRVCLQYLAEAFADPVVEEIALGIDEGGALVRDYLEFFSLPRMVPVDVGGTRSLGDTILRTLDARAGLVDAPLIVNLGDTVIEDFPRELWGRDVIVSAKTPETERWTLFRYGPETGLTISDKQFQEDPETWEAFTGLWSFAAPREFAAHLRATGGDFFGAVRAYYENREPVLFRTRGWVDFGHADNLNARRLDAVNTRYFNSISFAQRGAVIVKRSENAAKLCDEIRWYQAIPDELKPYIPRIFRASDDPNSPFVEMEFSSYPSLDEAFVFAALELDAWRRAFQELFGFLEGLRRYEVRDERVRDDLYTMTVVKTQERIDAYLAQSGDDPDAEWRLNGELLPTLSQVRQDLPSQFERLAPNADRLTLMHGDLCFGNVLYDPIFHLLKVIDPRGRFGSRTVHGDPAYDVAKLSHSALGGYDFLMTGQFRLTESNPGHYELRLRRGPYHAAIGEMFVRECTRHGFELDHVRRLESLLFLSMPPLHRDRPDRQRAMLLIGLSLYRQYLGS